MIMLVNPGIVWGQTVVTPISIGNPHSTRFVSGIVTNGADQAYMRNVWDMKLDPNTNKIFLGAGDAVSNAGSLVGPGGMDVYNLDPGNDNFTKEATIDEEQIDRFRLNNNKLQVPGHDQTGSDQTRYWERGSNGTWTSIPLNGSPAVESQHTFDIYKFSSTVWFAALGAKNTTTSIIISTDNGASWSNAACQDASGLTMICPSPASRAYQIFTTGPDLYVSWSSISPVFKYLSGTTVRQVAQPTVSAMVSPNSGIGLLAVRIGPGSVILGTQTIYLAGRPINFDKFDPYAVKSVDSSLNVTDLMPAVDSGKIYKPLDLLQSSDGNSVYLLGVMCNGTAAGASTSSSCTAGTTPIVTVHKNSILGAAPTSGKDWTEVLRFDAPQPNTFARSFEYANNTFYFGIGSNLTTSTPTRTGEILKVADPTSQSPTPSPPSTPAGILGDVDNNGKVNIFDCNQVLTDFGKTGSNLKGDADGNNVVNILDYNIILTNFGKIS